MGLKARSWAGCRFRSSPKTRMARHALRATDGTRLVEGFAAGEIGVVAGFQGVHKATNRVTTLGRAARHLAVALAAAISADRCDIYTDVDGVYTSNRASCRRRAGSKVAFDEILDSLLRAKVLQRAVELAMVNKVRLYVRSSFDIRRTLSLARSSRRGGNYGAGGRHRHRLLARRSAITSRDVADKPGVAAAIFVRWPTPTSTST